MNRLESRSRRTGSYVRRWSVDARRPWGLRINEVAGRAEGRFIAGAAVRKIGISWNRPYIADVVPKAQIAQSTAGCYDDLLPFPLAKSIAVARRYGL